MFWHVGLLALVATRHCSCMPPTAPQATVYTGSSHGCVYTKPTKLTECPTPGPTRAPTDAGETWSPSRNPTRSPSPEPTQRPSRSPTARPTTRHPTRVGTYTKQSRKHCAHHTTGSSYASLSAAQAVCTAFNLGGCSGVYDSGCNGRGSYKLCVTGYTYSTSSSSCVYKKPTGTRLLGAAVPMRWQNLKFC